MKFHRLEAKRMVGKRVGVTSIASSVPLTCADWTIPENVYSATP